MVNVLTMRNSASMRKIITEGNLISLIEHNGQNGFHSALFSACIYYYAQYKLYTKKFEFHNNSASKYDVYVCKTFEVINVVL